MTNDGVAFSHKGKHGLELGSLYVLTGSFVGECPLDSDSFELSRRILINRAHSHIADPVTCEDGLSPAC